MEWEHRKEEELTKMGPGNRTGGSPQPTGRPPKTPTPPNDDPDNLRSRAKDMTPTCENPALRTSKRSLEQGSQNERISDSGRESQNHDDDSQETGDPENGEGSGVENESQQSERQHPQEPAVT